MKCNNCKLSIDGVMLKRFSGTGDGYLHFVPIEESNESVAATESSLKLSGYSLPKEKYPKYIACPKCGAYPFGDKEVRLYETIRLVCFEEDGNAN